VQLPSAPQRPSTQVAAEQSPLSKHLAPIAQPGQPPPQSTSLSAPF
jgi:hypothetical protein